ncbi:unnamed protein product [Ceutorhynchus assimilis]|uniref:Odorant receptor n=1 Tax=Ceutorhynchus assimilis TaxID=467358 RepID=A0A9N9MBE4_9CUCU|nr:unnamed protein product [Ceutorhynchus assimilis]
MFTVTKYVMIWAGFWKLEIKENLKLPYKIWQLYMMWAYVSVTLGITGNVIYVLQRDPVRIIEAIGVAISDYTIMLKLLLCSQRKITQLLQIAVQDDEIVSSKNPTLNRMLCIHKKSVSIMGLFIVTYTFAFCFYLCIYGGPVQYRIYQMKFPNATEKPEYILSMWFPFDIQNHFDLALFLQCFIYIQSSAANFASMVHVNTLMSYAVIKLKMLEYYFRNFDTFPQEIHSEDPVYRNRMAVKNLENLIRKHQFIIGFIKDLNECMRTTLLIEFSLSSLMLASITSQIISSGDIAFAIYESDWYNYNAKVGKLIFIVVMRARRELTLDIGPFGPNTLEAAKTRMQVAYSYLSVISGSKRNN